MTEGSKQRDREAGRLSAGAAAMWLAWSLAALSVVMFIASGVLYLLARSTQVPGRWIAVGTVGDVLIAVPFLAFPLVGALIASRRPRNPIGWICLADGLLWMLINISDYYSIYGVARPGSLPYPVAVGTLGNQWLWVPTIGLLGIYLLLLFPDGKLPSERWRPLGWFSGAVILSLSFAGGLAPGPMENQGGVPNPFGLEGLPWLADLATILLPLLPLCIVASAVSMVVRFRHAEGEERQQIKWIAFVASFAGLVYLCALVGALLLVPGLSNGGGEAPPVPVWVDLLISVAVLGFAGVPVAIGFAVLKYRLYDIDVVINRTLVYGPLTISLVAAYFGGVVVLQRIFVVLTGQKSTLAVVVSTLAIAAIFNPSRRRIQSLVDRRFYRRKYDARKTLEAFSSRLRNETDLEALGDDLVGVVRETMQPEHVSVWLQPTPAAKSEPQ